MSQQGNSVRRWFVSLVEIERDTADVDAGGWVTFDSFAKKRLYYYEVMRQGRLTPLCGAS